MPSARMCRRGLARSLLATALDDADPDAARITEILAAIPGAWEATGRISAGPIEKTSLDAVELGLQTEFEALDRGAAAEVVG